VHGVDTAAADIFNVGIMNDFLQHKPFLVFDD